MVIRDIEKQNKQRNAIWICDWCTHENDSRLAVCEKCGGVRKSA